MTLTLTRRRDAAAHRPARHARAARRARRPPVCPHPAPNPKPKPKPDQVRDDHLCEERGLRATQELLREKLLRPLKRIWDEHSRSWCCGVKIRPEDQALYGQRRKRKGGIIDVE